MKFPATLKRLLPVLLCFGLVLGVAGPIDFTPSAEANPAAKLRKAKKTIRKEKAKNRQLRRQLAAALAQVPKAPQLEMVTVGNLGNPPDQDFGDGQFGTVPYEFQIGKYEVSLEDRIPEV